MFAWMSALSNRSRPTACSWVWVGVEKLAVVDAMAGAWSTSDSDMAISLSSFTLSKTLLISSLFSGCFALRKEPADTWRSLSAIW